MTNDQRDAIRLAIASTQALGEAIITSITVANESDPDSARVCVPRFGAERMATFCVELKGFLEQLLEEDHERS